MTISCASSAASELEEVADVVGPQLPDVPPSTPPPLQRHVQHERALYAVLTDIALSGDIRNPDTQSYALYVLKAYVELRDLVSSEAWPLDAAAQRVVNAMRARAVMFHTLMRQAYNEDE